jgi:hypothetical protein
MTRWTWVLAVLAVGAGCSGNTKQAAPPRAELRSVSGSTVEVLPTAEQLPYCLLYTLSDKGVIRQLTMTRENRSIRCEAGKPIANTSFRIPANEGNVKVYVIFSDERIQAGPIAQQLFELKNQPRISAMDLRLPGRVFVETLDFAPKDDGKPVTGGVVNSTGEVKPTEPAQEDAKEQPKPPPPADTLPVETGSPTAASPTP